MTREVRRIVVPKPGGYDALRLEPAPPPPGPGVRVKVACSGVNYADCVVRMGLYESAKKYVGYPIVPGFEVSGVVTEIEGDSGGLAVGDRVLALTRFGGYASEIVVPPHQVFPMPRDVTDAEGAGLLATSLTAWHALVDLAAPRRGASILVHSAAGGVGSMLVSIAKARGLFVVGVVGGPHKVDEARARGCDEVVDKSREAWAARARAIRPAGYGAVFDANGAETLSRSYALLAAPGRLVVYGFHSMLPRTGGKPDLLRLARTFLATPRFSPLDMTGKNRSVMAFNLSYLFEEADLLRDALVGIRALVETGELRPARTETYRAEDVAAAHAALESGRTVGKLTLLWD